MEYSATFEIKAVGEDGTFEGIASVCSEEDLGGDIIEKGAFTKTISENPSVPILWQHDSTEVIGSGEVSESGKKVLVRGKLDLDDPTAQKAYRKLKARLIKGLSIGFQAIKSKWEEIQEGDAHRYIRRIQELKLWEISIVTFPMQPAAQVTGVKTAEDTERRLREIESKIQALQAPPPAVVTPQEPTQAPEPPATSTEPVLDHSLLKSILTTFKGGDQHGAQ